jgi:hypothetical protein
MPHLFSRRKMIGAGGAAAIAPLVVMKQAAQAQSVPLQVTGPVFVLFEPVRVFDSRVADPAIGGGKIASGSSVGVSVGGVAGELNPIAVFANITITETEGAGFILVRASDLSGERPLPKTSNVNWSQNGQTLANLVFTVVGGENTIEIHAGGSGRTHFIVDVQAYIPFLPT